MLDQVLEMSSFSPPPPTLLNSVRNPCLKLYSVAFYRVFILETYKMNKQIHCVRETPYLSVLLVYYSSDMLRP